jgi:hypothetical protein
MSIFPLAAFREQAQDLSSPWIDFGRIARVAGRVLWVEINKAIAHTSMMAKALLANQRGDGTR